ncbi:hypothetical protein Dimus_003831 [Dionaea muscipula]
MDLTYPKFCQSPSLPAAQEEQQQFVGKTGVYCKDKGNLFEEAFNDTDPLRKLNLKETTSEFVKSLPNGNGNEMSREIIQKGNGGSVGFITVTHKKMEAAPPTPGRPVFSFSVSRKTSVPSKWDDAEKWLIGTGSCHESPAHHHHAFTIKSSKQFDGFKQQSEVLVEKSRVSEDKGSKESFQGFNDLDHCDPAITFDGAPSPAPGPALADTLLKDKFTNEVEPFFPNCRYSEPTKREFFIRNQVNCEPMKDAGTDVIHEIKHRDIGTEMTPLGSSTNSTCHTPFKSTSPVRHNTPENRSGPLALVSSNAINSVDITQLQEHHLAKLNIGSTIFDSITSNWSSREEEEEESSKSLRHSEVNNGARKSVCEARFDVWEEEEKTKHCLRYQREEAKIQAWVNLQHAKAEAQSKKLEVKIQKMRSDLEEKQMKRMAVVHRKVEEWRAEAQLEHAEQIRKATERALKMMARNDPKLSPRSSCGCFPCNNNIHH